MGQLGGLAGPYLIGFLNVRTRALSASFALIALMYFAAGGVIASLRIEVRWIHRAAQLTTTSSVSRSAPSLPTLLAV